MIAQAALPSKFTRGLRSILTAAVSVVCLGLSITALGAESLERLGKEYGTWIGGETDGAGMAAINIDDDPRPDVFFAWADNPHGENRLLYRVAKNLDSSGSSGKSTVAWSNEIAIGKPGPYQQGVGLATGFINDNDRPDLVAVVMDDPDGENNVRYYVGWDIDKDGKAASWSPLYKEDSWYGGNSAGLGAALWDIDDNGKQDLVVGWSDAPAGKNRFYYRVFWNLDPATGKHDKVSDDTNGAAYEIPYDGGLDEQQGVGLELADLDSNDRPDLIFAIADNPSGENKNRYVLAWNLDGEGKWSHCDKQIRNLGNSYGFENEGMGLAVARVDGHYPYELIYGVVDAPQGENRAMFWMEPNWRNDDARGPFKDWSTKGQPVLVRHQGNLIACHLTNDEQVSCRARGDFGGWTDDQRLTFPSSSDPYSPDQSVLDRQEASDPIQFDYDTKGDALKGAPVRVISDGMHIYVFRISTDRHLLVDRFVLDHDTGQLRRGLDTRYVKTGRRHDYGDDKHRELGFQDNDSQPFYEPTTRIQRMSDVRDFAVLVLPASLPEEERWQIFSLNGGGKIDAVSFRRAETGLFTSEDKEVTYDADNKKRTLKGIVAFSFTPADTGARSDGRFYGTTATLFANQQKCDGKVVKTTQRVMLAAPAGNDGGPLLTIDFGVDRDGLLSDLQNRKDRYTDVPCDELDDEDENQEKAYTVASNRKAGAVASTPLIYEGADGFLHLLFKYKDEAKFKERIYDPLTDQWISSSTKDGDGKRIADQVRGGAGIWDDTFKNDPYVRYPTLYYAQELGAQLAGVAEYGVYVRASDGSPSGELRRMTLFVKEDGIYPVTEKVADLKAKYLSDIIIDATLTGYVEGAPPFPRENTAKGDDETGDDDKYDGATSIKRVNQDGLSHSYVQAKDVGFDFEAEGHAGWGNDHNALAAAFKFEFGKSRLQEKRSADEETTTIARQQSLVGSYTGHDDGLWHPENYGYAVVRSTAAKVYALLLGEGERLVGYNVVPKKGSDEEHFLRFRMNPHYVKNGTLDGRVGEENDEDWSTLAEDEVGSYYAPGLWKGEGGDQTEFEKLREKFKKARSDRRSYYWNYKSRAFADMPDQDKIAARENLNTYEWNCGGGSSSNETTYANMQGEMDGGSFHFLGMGGVYGKWGERVESTVLAGGHYDRTFTKETSDTETFWLEGNVTQGTGCANLPPGQVDAYDWATLYQDNSAAHFNEFFERVVDPDWLNGKVGNDDYPYVSGNEKSTAKTLRDARNRVNPVWRIRHFVTYVSRIFR